MEIAFEPPIGDQLRSLAADIRTGRANFPQVIQTRHDFLRCDNYSWSACALGYVALARGFPLDVNLAVSEHILAFLDARHPILTRYLLVECPVAGTKRCNLRVAIEFLNDVYGWPPEWIADWVETLYPNHGVTEDHDVQVI